MLDTEEADEDTDWAPDVEVGLDFFDLVDMLVRLFAEQAGAKTDRC